MKPRQVFFNYDTNTYQSVNKLNGQTHATLKNGKLHPQFKPYLTGFQYQFRRLPKTKQEYVLPKDTKEPFKQTYIINFNANKLKSNAPQTSNHKLSKHSSLNALDEPNQKTKHCNPDQCHSKFAKDEQPLNQSQNIRKIGKQNSFFYPVKNIIQRSFQKLEGNPNKNCSNQIKNLSSVKNPTTVFNKSKNQLNFNKINQSTKDGDKIDQIKSSLSRIKNKQQKVTNFQKSKIKRSLIKVKNQLQQTKKNQQINAQKSSYLTKRQKGQTNHKIQKLKQQFQDTKISNKLKKQFQDAKLDSKNDLPTIMRKSNIQQYQQVRQKYQKPSLISTKRSKMAQMQRSNNTKSLFNTRNQGLQLNSVLKNELENSFSISANESCNIQTHQKIRLKQSGMTKEYLDQNRNSINSPSTLENTSKSYSKLAASGSQYLNPGSSFHMKSLFKQTKTSNELNKSQGQLGITINRSDSLKSLLQDYTNFRKGKQEPLEQIPKLFEYDSEIEQTCKSIVNQLIKNNIRINKNGQLDQGMSTTTQFKKQYRSFMKRNQDSKEEVNQRLNRQIKQRRDLLKTFEKQFINSQNARTNKIYNRKAGSQEEEFSRD